MADHSPFETIRQASTLSILWGVLLIVFGMLAVGSPFIAAVAVSVAVAWLIILAGVVHLMLALHAHRAGRLVWKLLVGLAYVFFGVYMILHPVLGVASLSLVIAVLFLIDGILDVILFFNMRSMRGAFWVLVDGIVPPVRSDDLPAMAVQCGLGDRRFGRSEHDYQRCHASDVVVVGAENGCCCGIAVVLHQVNHRRSRVRLVDFVKFCHKRRKEGAEMNTAFLVGRIIFGGYWLMASFNHFKNLNYVSEYAKARGTPSPKLAVAGTGVILLLGGLSMLLGVYPVVGIILLIVFLLGVSFQMHAYWKMDDAQMKQIDMINFTKNMALIGFSDRPCLGAILRVRCLHRAKSLLETPFHTQSVLSLDR
jgi:putative oxidoreductase